MRMIMRGFPMAAVGGVEVVVVVVKEVGAVKGGAMGEGWRGIC
jgi:hypothetical protein